MRSRRVANVYRLGRKEFASLLRDPVLVFMILYSFSYAVYVPAATTGLELRNAPIAFVDEDRSQLSARLRDAVVPPYFKPPARVPLAAVDRAMDAGRYTFVVDVPPDFEADLLAGRVPELQILIDATAMSQAGIGAGRLQQIFGAEIEEFATRQRGAVEPAAMRLVVRAAFNPNLYESWYLGIVQMTNNIALLAILLTGAALLREREHGTLEHLLVMPLSPLEIALAKVWSNGLVIVVASLLSLGLVVHGALGVPIRGSVPLFTLGTVAFLFSATAIGIFLSTLVRSMPQFGLLMVPVVLPMIVLSGGMTPLENMPEPLQWVMRGSPTTHFLAFATAVLYRGADFAAVWKPFLAITAIGAAFFAAALWRFRASVAVGER
jgi:ABC-2 type transport system permease protein